MPLFAAVVAWPGIQVRAQDPTPPLPPAAPVPATSREAELEARLKQMEAVVEKLSKQVDQLSKAAERDAALLELARERDDSRAAFDLAEATRLSLAEQLDALVQEHARHSCAGGASGENQAADEVITALVRKTEVLGQERDELAQAKSASETEKLALLAEIERLNAEHSEVKKNHASAIESLDRIKHEHALLFVEHERLQRAYAEISSGHQTAAQTAGRFERDSAPLLAEVDSLT